MRLRILGVLGVLAIALAAGGIAGTAAAAPDDPAPADAAAQPAPADASPAAKSGPPDWKDVPVVTLREAVERRLVDVSGRDPEAYRKVTLRLRSRADERLAIDLAGSYVVPTKRGSCQRLGIGPAVTPSASATPPATTSRGAGTVVVQLEPRATEELRVNTCCLDAGLPCPDGNTYVGTEEKLPEVRETVLRWWADNPTAPQSAVNQAIWEFRPDVRLAPGVVPDYARPSGRFVQVHRGVCYRVTDGELTATDQEGVLRLLGSEVFQVIPTDDGLYAVALGDDRKPKLFLVPMTAEKGWTKVADLDGSSRLRDVFRAERGSLVLVTDKGIDWIDGATHATSRALQTELIADLSVRRGGKDELVATIRRPPRPPVYQGGKKLYESAAVSELWSLSLETGKAERVRELWNVESILCGPAGTYGLTHTQGQLQRLVREKFEDVGGDAAYGRIVAVARDLVWLAPRGGKLVAVDAKSGAVRVRADVSDDGLVFDVDPDTGDLAYVVGDDVHWVHAADGRDEKLPPR